MALQCGIVGLPNVGKSTLFNALTKDGIEAANYPFCTIEPNVGIVEVPDPRLAKLAEIVQPQKIQPAIVEFVDIAGLIAGASKGEGLGNQFLANIHETDAIVNVVRCFDDPNVVHVNGRVDPIADIETIVTELALADLATIERVHAREIKKARAGDKEALRLTTLLEKLQPHLNEGKQETMLSVYRAAEGFKGDAQVGSWLFAILKNKITDCLRQIKRQREVFATPAEEMLDEVFEEQFSSDGHWTADGHPQTWASPEKTLDNKEFREICKPASTKCRKTLPACLP